MENDFDRHILFSNMIKKEIETIFEKNKIPFTKIVDRNYFFAYNIMGKQLIKIVTHKNEFVFNDNSFKKKNTKNFLKDKIFFVENNVLTFRDFCDSVLTELIMSSKNHILIKDYLL